MLRYKCTVSYVGTRYAGWQIQEKAHPPLTIQGELEKVVRTVTKCPLRVHGAGRTDSGVHAEGQVMHFTLPPNPSTPHKEKSCEEWENIFHAMLPSDICVHKVEKVDESFHSRFSAQKKTYAYTLWTQRNFAPPRLRPFMWAPGKLNVAAMHQALPYLMGKHDFAALQNVGTPVEDTLRHIYSLELHQGSPWAPEAFHPHILTLTAEADGFLKQMVRNITGLLVAVGQGRFAAQHIPALLQSRHRPNAPATAPPQGLSLLKVHYPT